MKKKIVAIALAVAVLAIAVVGGSVAWFMDEDAMTNVFTVGSIEIEQNENFVQNSMLLPIVDTADPSADDNFVTKEVNVSNVGENEAYVQTLIAVPALLDNTDPKILHIYDENAVAGGWVKVDGDADATNGFTPKYTNVDIDGILHNVYLYRYATELAVGATTANVIDGVYVDAAIDLNTYDTDNDGTTDSAKFVVGGTEIDFEAAGTLNVYVTTQAVQVSGFDSAAAALDAAFTTHPW